VSKETYISGKRALPTLAYLRSAQMSKETYLSGKRGPLTLAYLRYAEVSKEAYLYDKRSLFIWQKKPIETD